MPANKPQKLANALTLAAPQKIPSFCCRKHKPGVAGEFRRVRRASWPEDLYLRIYSPTIPGKRVLALTGKVRVARDAELFNSEGSIPMFMDKHGTFLGCDATDWLPYTAEPHFSDVTPVAGFLDTKAPCSSVPIT